jgi:hypothetical protein
MIAAALIKPVGWWVVLGSAAIGTISAVAGYRVWHGLPINPRNTLDAENRLSVLTVTLLPGAAMFLAWSLIALGGEADGVVHNEVLRAILLIIELGLVLLSLVAAAVGVSLFFFSKPQRFVPPHLRETREGSPRTE